MARGHGAQEESTFAVYGPTQKGFSQDLHLKNARCFSIFTQTVTKSGNPASDRLR